MLNTLAKLREEREEGEKGFTLIELLVVVVIIGVLVAIAIPLYLNYRKGAENKDAQSDVRNAIGAIENCYADNGNKYPGTGRRQRHRRRHQPDLQVGRHRHRDRGDDRQRRPGHQHLGR